MNSFSYQTRNSHVAYNFYWHFVRGISWCLGGVMNSCSFMIVIGYLWFSFLLYERWNSCQWTKLASIFPLRPRKTFPFEIPQNILLLLLFVDFIKFYNQDSLPTTLRGKNNNKLLTFPFYFSFSLCC